MLSRIVMIVLHRLSPEWAHHIVILLLQLKQRLWRPLWRMRRLPAPAIRLSQIEKLSFRNRLGLAAGFDKNAEVFPALLRMGFGFVEVGTVTPLPQAGNSKPRIWRTKDKALVNALGFNNVGLARFCKNLENLRALASGPVLANIGKGMTVPIDEAAGEYEKGFRQLENLVDGFVVNVSSPNTENLRELQNAKFLESILSLAPRTLPTFVKLAPDLSDESLGQLCRQIAESSFAGVVLTNTSRALADEQGFPKGGLSGPPLFDRALECVSIAKEVMKEKKTIIAVGGVTSPLHYQRMRSAGADLVEVYTGFVYYGPSWVKALAKHAD